jgi:hypothetical protein
MLIHTELAFTTSNRTSSVVSPLTIKNNSNNYVIITNFSVTVYLLAVTVLVEVHSSISIEIQDSKFTNKLGVNKEYRLFSCDSMYLVHVFGGRYCFHLQGSKGSDS